MPGEPERGRGAHPCTREPTQGVGLAGNALVSQKAPPLSCKVCQATLSSTLSKAPLMSAPPPRSLSSAHMKVKAAYLYLQCSLHPLWPCAFLLSLPYLRRTVYLRGRLPSPAAIGCQPA